MSNKNFTNFKNVNMKNVSERTQVAKDAINMLKDGVKTENFEKINSAFDMVNDGNFSWNNLDELYMEWDDLSLKVDDLFLNKHES